MNKKEKGNSVSKWFSFHTENSLTSTSYCVCAYRIIQNWLTEYECIQIHIRAKFLVVHKI